MVVLLWYHLLRMTTIFSKIIAREIPAHVVYEDDVCIVIMDIFPSVPGQVLVVPKVEIDYVFDVPDDVYQHLLHISKRIGKALDTVFATERTCIVVEGFEVPHVHIKLYPTPKGSTSLTSLLQHTSEVDNDELKKQSEAIKAALT